MGKFPGKKRFLNTLQTHFCQRISSGSRTFAFKSNSLGAGICKNLQKFPNFPAKSLRKNRENFEKFSRSFREFPIFKRISMGSLWKSEISGQLPALLTILVAGQISKLEIPDLRSSDLRKFTKFFSGTQKFSQVQISCKVLFYRKPPEFLKTILLGESFCESSLHLWTKNA